MNDRPRLLIADDQAANRLILQHLLADTYDVTVVGDGSEALAWLAAGGEPDLILLDVMMPGVDGFETCAKIKGDPKTHDIPVIFLTSLDSPTDEEHGLSLGAGDFIHKPFSPPVVLARVKNHILLAGALRDTKRHSDVLESVVAARTREVVRQAEQLARRNRQLQAAQDATITAFCSLAEARDNETGNHIRRTQNYVRTIAEELRRDERYAPQLDDDTIRLLFKSAPLHDIGKVAVPDAVLLKPGKLTPEEWVIMKRHCEFGRTAIVQAIRGLDDDDAGFLRFATEIAYGHHEKWNGSGYPQGQAGEQIPISARLMAIADVYDALITKRVYKPAFSHERALEIMTLERGTHFDPTIFDAFSRVAERFRGIAESYRDDDAEGLPTSAPR